MVLFIANDPMAALSASTITVLVFIYILSVMVVI
jgi:hypothetical protein